MAAAPSPLHDPTNPLGRPRLQRGWAGGLAGPDSLDGGTGPGFARPLPGPAASSPASPAPDTRGLITRLLNAGAWSELQHWAAILLGPTSFDLGFCYGLVNRIKKDLIQAVGGLLDLLKMIVLAGLYERAMHAPPWWDAPDYAEYWAARGMQTLIGRRMEEAHREMEQLVQELSNIIHHPLQFLEQAAGKLKAETVHEWRRYERLMSSDSVSDKFAAGELCGEVLAEVALTLLLVGSVAGAAARWAAKIPQVMRVVEALRLARVAEGADAARLGEEVKAGKEAEEANEPTSRAVRSPSKIAQVDPRKFSDYIFKDGATHGKDTVFRSLGYTKEDSQALADLYSRQAEEKFLNGDYALGKLDQYGQRINIGIDLPGQGDAAGKMSYLNSGWMMNPDGTISLNTPFSGFTK